MAIHQFQDVVVGMMASLKAVGCFRAGYASDYPYPLRKVLPPPT
jgi:hypothetical protein